MPTDLHTESLRVPYRGRDFEVYQARPQGEGAVPAVLVVHEWWGLNDHIRDVADRLAREGFRALAPDLFDGRVTKDAQEAAAMMAALDQKEAVGKLSAVVDSIGANAGSGTGVLGFCMGGSYTLELTARDGRIRAAVPFYGQVPGDEVLAGLRAPVLFFAAGRDQWITREETGRLAAYLRRAGLPGEVVRYADADHAFFNDTREGVYRADLAQDAWKRAVAFLKQHLGAAATAGTG
jgi:carboxymethylenebutenolidase